MEGAREVIVVVHCFIFLQDVMQRCTHKMKSKSRSITVHKSEPHPAKLLYTFAWIWWMFLSLPRTLSHAPRALLWHLGDICLKYILSPACMSAWKPSLLTTLLSALSCCPCIHTPGWSLPHDSDIYATVSRWKGNREKRMRQRRSVGRSPVRWGWVIISQQCPCE